MVEGLCKGPMASMGLNSSQAIVILGGFRVLCTLFNSRLSVQQCPAGLQSSRVLETLLMHVIYAPMHAHPLPYSNCPGPQNTGEAHLCVCECGSSSLTQWQPQLTHPGQLTGGGRGLRQPQGLVVTQQLPAQGTIGCSPSVYSYDTCRLMSMAEACHVSYLGANSEASTSTPQ